MGRERGYSEVKTPQLYDAELWRTSGHWDKYREQHVRDQRGRGSRDGPQADELPRPLRTLLDASATPTASCRCAISEPGPAPPQRALRGPARAAAGAPVRDQDDGHIFCTEEQVAGRGRGLPGIAFATYELFDLEARLELSTRPRAADRRRRDVGPRRGGADRRARPGGPRVRAQPRRRRLLRAEDRHAHDRLARALLAARDRAARLLRCPSASASPTPAPTTPSTAR